MAEYSADPAVNAAVEAARDDFVDVRDRVAAVDEAGHPENAALLTEYHEKKDAFVNARSAAREGRPMTITAEQNEE